MTDDSLLNPDRQSLTTRALRLADALDDSVRWPDAARLIRELVAEIERLRAALAAEEA